MTDFYFNKKEEHFQLILVHTAVDQQFLKQMGTNTNMKEKQINQTHESLELLLYYGDDYHKLQV